MHDLEILEKVIDHQKEKYHIKICYKLSNDPGKTGNNSFCYGMIYFPHIEMFSFSHRECINLQKGSLQNKMYLNSISKGCFFSVKEFQPIRKVTNNSQEKFTILHVSHIAFLCY